MLPGISATRTCTGRSSRSNRATPSRATSASSTPVHHHHHHALLQEASNFEQVKETRDRDIKTRISSLMLDRDAFREAYNEAMGELRVKEEMIKSLQGQVRGLKSFVSTSSKMDEQVTDEAFGERMQRLGNGLQNWVITNFRRVKIGMLLLCWLEEPFLFQKPVLHSLCSFPTAISFLRALSSCSGFSSRGYLYISQTASYI